MGGLAATVVGTYMYIVTLVGLVPKPVTRVREDVSALAREREERRRVRE